MQPWWGQYRLQPGETGQWDIGPLRLCLRREANDWIVGLYSAPQPLVPTLSVSVPCATPDWRDLACTRFAFESGHEQLRLTPRLADRPITVRPEHPVTVPSGQAVTFYISTPLWLRLAVGDPAILLDEWPSFRPSDAWFGTPLRGELCYASRTRAQSRLDDIVATPNRAITPIRVVNRAVESLRIEQLKLPMPNLALYQDAEGRLMTQSLEFMRSAAGGQAQLKLGAPPPAGQLLSDARLSVRGNRIAQVFDWVRGASHGAPGEV